VKLNTAAPNFSCNLTHCTTDLYILIWDQKIQVYLFPRFVLCSGVAAQLSHHCKVHNDVRVLLPKVFNNCNFS